MYSMLLDDVMTGRTDARSKLDERLLRPLDPEEATEQDEENWARMNAEAMAGMPGGEAQPVNR